MSIDLSQFHQVFFEESFEGLDIMETSLMELDPAQPDSETINTIFRSAHSIKGGSATFNFTIVAGFTHILETLLDEVRDGKRQLETPDIDLLLQSVDCLRELISALQEETGADNTLVDKLTAAFHQRMAMDSEVKAEPDEVASVAASQGWTIKFVPVNDILLTGNEPLRMLRELLDLAPAEAFEVNCKLDKLPSFASLNPLDCYLSWQINVEQALDKAEIDEIFEWVIDDSEVVVEALNAPESFDVEATPSSDATLSADKNTNAQVANKTPVKAVKSKPVDSSIRVSTEKIDQLINMVGELVITQSMLGQVGEDFNLERLAQLKEGLAQLEQNTRELQESVMQIRMLPISFSFSRFPRMVRDLSQRLEKKIELVMHGENTELDKTVMEKIGDPLVHLVRNAIDHGIEMPADRLAAGKKEQGVITLNAFHQGGNVVIEIQDDGKGLDREMLIKKAIDNGLLNGSETLSDEQAFDLIFAPGFSTAQAVSDISGRGVGMDVVKRNIQALNGTIELRSVLGQGSKIIIRLPLTLAILDGQLVSVGEETFIFPLVSIVESLQVDSQQVNQVAGGCDVLCLRDEYVPIINLYQVFNLPASHTEIDGALVVVVEHDSEKVGIMVDDLLAQQQVVIKSLEQNYQRIEGVSGATILGDGTVSLILDIGGIVKMAGGIHKTKAMQLQANQKQYVA